MDSATVAHTLVAAHAARVVELARLYHALDRAVSAGVDGVDGDAAHAALALRIVAWTVADVEAEQRDLVMLAAEARDTLQAALARAATHLERAPEHQAPDPRDGEVVRRLWQWQAAPPSTLPRAIQRRVRRSAQRLARLEALNAPEFTLRNEAHLLAQTLTPPEPISPSDMAVAPSWSLAETFMRGLHACVILEPGAAGAIDLGLGVSPLVRTLPGLSDVALDGLDPSHVAPYPLVPRARFADGRAPALVPIGLESTGPLGWAAGDDVAELARALDALAHAHANFAGELPAVSARVTAAGQRGEAVIGLIEHLPPESDGERSWLVASADE